MVLTEEAILALAPDAASAKAGRSLASGNGWSGVGTDGQAAWGLCKGSGSKPYQTQVDLSEPAFKCSCPSRKFPCKHALGLLLRLARNPAGVESQPPEWVTQWLDSRSSRTAKAVEKKATAEPFDPAKEAARRAKRLQATAGQLVEFRRWMADLVATGIAGVPGRGFAFFDEPARRMVDAKAPGLARMIGDLGSIAAGGGAGWESRFVAQLGRIDLLCEAAMRGKDLPDALRREVESAIGIPVTSAELAALPTVEDVWQCFAQDVEQEDNLRVKRSWLIGSKSGRVALLLNFAHGTGPLDVRLVVGRQYTAGLTPYPGGGLRAALPDGELHPEPVGAWRLLDSLTAFADARAEALAGNPWLERFAAPVHGLMPDLYRDRCRLVDVDGRGIELAMNEDDRWRLLAVSGGRAVDAAVEASAGGFRLLSLLASGEVARFGTAGAVAA